MIRRPPRSTLSSSSAASDVYKRQSRHSFDVRLHELDPMGHVNNAVYVDWLDEAVHLVDPVVIRVVPRRYRLEYRAAAAPGADLVGQAWPDGEGWSYRLEDG